jgi:hypothetical protein
MIYKSDSFFLNNFWNFFLNKNGQILIFQYQYAHGFSSVKISHPHKTIVSILQNLKNHLIQYLKTYLNKERKPFGNSGINITFLTSIN